MRFASDSKTAITKGLSRVIYVEGDDDAWFIDKLLCELNADPNIVGVVYLNGDGALDKEISLLVKSAAYVRRETLSLAIILDADTSVENRMLELTNTLAKRGIPQPVHDTAISYDNGRQIATFIMPDGTNPGELEDLLLETVADDLRLQIVKQALTDVEEAFAPLNKRSKRIARMYMSVLDVKPCGVGRAYREGVFDGTHPAINAIRNFLERFCA